MDWAGQQHPVDTLVEWLAPLPLAAAVGWAAQMLGLSLVEAAAVAVALVTVGFAAIRLAGGNGHFRRFDFQPADLGDELGDPGELLLSEEDELLELNDPLLEVAPDHRVVRLFERQETTPGELVARISDFLGDGQKAPAGEIARLGVGHVDASAALHAALANIRASLR